MQNLRERQQVSEQTATGPLASARCTGDVGLPPAR